VYPLRSSNNSPAEPRSPGLPRPATALSRFGRYTAGLLLPTAHLENALDSQLDHSACWMVRKPSSSNHHPHEPRLPQIHTGMRFVQRTPHFSYDCSPPTAVSNVHNSTGLWALDNLPAPSSRSPVPVTIGSAGGRDRTVARTAPFQPGHPVFASRVLDYGNAGACPEPPIQLHQRVAVSHPVFGRLYRKQHRRRARIGPKLAFGSGRGSSLPWIAGCYPNPIKVVNPNHSGELRVRENRAFWRYLATLRFTGREIYRNRVWHCHAQNHLYQRDIHTIKEIGLLSGKTPLPQFR
jgi:hypothetical protein